MRKRDKAYRRTGYYVSGQDWPAILNDFSISDIYQALEGISDEAVEAARKTLVLSLAGQPDAS